MLVSKIVDEGRELVRLESSFNELLFPCHLAALLPDGKMSCELIMLNKCCGIEPESNDPFKNILCSCKMAQRIHVSKIQDQVKLVLLRWPGAAVTVFLCW